MNWIRTCDFKWVNLDYVICIWYENFYSSYQEGNHIIGYVIEGEFKDGQIIAFGYLVDESEAIECINAITKKKDLDWDLLPRDEIIEIYRKKKEE